MNNLIFYSPMPFSTGSLSSRASAERAAKLFSVQLRSRLSAKSIDRAFNQLPVRDLVVNDEKKLVCSLQVKIKIYRSLSHMLEDIDEYVSAAAEKGAGLICFPELFGLLLVCANPGVRSLLKNAGIASMLSGKKSGDIDIGSFSYDIAPIFKHFDFMYSSYIRIMSLFAQKYGVWISAGSTFAYENGRVYNRHSLVDAGGRLAAQQDKLHLVPMEASLGLSAGKELSVVPTPFGNIALTVCMDASYFETYKIAAGLGADFVIIPIANMEEYNRHLALRGAKSRTCETGLPSVKAALVSGVDFPITFSGRAGIYYPPGYEKKSRETPQGTRPAVLIDHIDISSTRSWSGKRLNRENKEFNRVYLEYLLKRSGDGKTE